MLLKVNVWIKVLTRAHCFGNAEKLQNKLNKYVFVIYVSNKTSENFAVKITGKYWKIDKNPIKGTYTNSFFKTLTN